MCILSNCKDPEPKFPLAWDKPWGLHEGFLEEEALFLLRNSLGLEKMNKRSTKGWWHGNIPRLIHFVNGLHGRKWLLRNYNWIMLIMK